MTETSAPEPNTSTVPEAVAVAEVSPAAQEAPSAAEGSAPDASTTKASETVEPAPDTGDPAAAEATAPKANSPTAATRGGRAERGRGGGYVNRERVNTGGPAREKLTPEQLAEKMERVKLQNAKILERRQLVEKDKDDYSALTAAERAARAEAARKAAENKKLQLALEEERNKNRARKLGKIEGRAWDSEKTDEELWKNNFRAYGRGEERGRGGYGRGTPRGRGGDGTRGRGGRGGSSGGAPAKAQAPALESTADFPALGGKPASSTPSAQPASESAAAETTEEAAKSSSTPKDKTQKDA